MIEFKMIEFEMIASQKRSAPDKTIRKTISSLDKPKLYGPEKYPVYLHLPSLDSVASFPEDKVKDIVGNTYGAVKLRVAHFTKKWNGIHFEWNLQGHYSRPRKTQRNLSFQMLLRQ